jgi:ribosomal RNA-processing protein 17
LQGQPVEPEEEEYEDEEQLATVTVVEDFDPDTIIHGPPRIPSSPGDDESMEYQSRSSTKAKSASNSATTPSIMTTEPTKAWAKSNLSVKTKLKMSKKVRYQTKAERGLEKKKQRARRTEKAERAGGKASRSSISRGKGKKR